MRFIVLLVSILFLQCRQNTAPAQALVLHSQFVNDSFLVEVRLPDNYNKDSSYHLLYVADGSIGLGDYVHGRDSSWKAEIPDNCLIITIGHIGDYHVKRRRDFIPSDAGGHRNENFGQAMLFHDFLKNELIPLIEKDYNRKSRSFIGHSFSGLFSLYAALKNDGLFDHHFAISPSVWANKGELLKIEENFFKSSRPLKASIQIYVGGLEVFNKVLSSSREFYNSILSRNYNQTIIGFEITNNANHFSIRKPAIDKILNRFR